jgi:hypothetical protein
MTLDECLFDPYDSGQIESYLAKSWLIIPPCLWCVSVAVVDIKTPTQ